MQRQAWLFGASCSDSHYFCSFTKCSEGVLGKDGLIEWLKVWRISIMVRLTGQNHADCPSSGWHLRRCCAAAAPADAAGVAGVTGLLDSEQALGCHTGAAQLPNPQNLHLRNCTQPTRIGQIGVSGGLNTAPISVVLKCLRAAHS
jgi:hypothetical protein